MADWDEVKKLAADFQRVQLSSTKQKLSERNVIEIVTKLVEFGQLEVIYTVDGKEYITPQELVKEIKEELLVHGGRVNLVELTQILNIDFSHIESKANEIVSREKNIMLVLGQLIDQRYMDKLAEEVNDKLQEKGHVTIPELTKQYDLSAEFLVKNLHSRFGTIIKGQIDSYDRDVIFTDAFIQRMRAQIRGAFSAVTRPVLVGSFIQQYKFQERIFLSSLEELVNSKVLHGTLSGRQDNATYIPDIYTKSQNEWVDSFYKQNGYLEYDALKRLGISDPKDFIKKRFKCEHMIYLGTCCMGRALQEQVEASMEEALADGTWVDIMDAKSHSVFRGVLEAGEPGTIKSEGPTGNTKEDRKDQRRKKATVGSGNTKSGGGTQGREIKTKAVKKKGYKGRDHDNDSDEEMAAKPKSRSTEIEFMTLEEIADVLKKDVSLRDCPDELISEIAQQLIRPLTKEYQDVAKSIYLQTSGASSHERKKTHGELNEKLVGLWTNVRLFEKGLKLFNDETQTNLVRHLLRTVCTDITNVVLNSVATDQMLSIADETKFTNESRVKLIGKLPSNIQGDLQKLNTSLNGKSLDDFFNALDVLCGPSHLSILFKKPDKKKERQLTFSHRQALCEQLTSETDAAMTLHLACVVLFHKFTQCILHVPGKCVPQIILFLKDHMEPEKFKEFTTLQDLVIAQLQKQQSAENDEGHEAQMIEETVAKVKDIALTTKKSTQNVAAAED
ncbi:E3 UFM1-protein ligase 1-like isoform X2 [Mercenaria mercenaria]|uniref:E3 UFM1-protein ligase 1-like isoform X2 n=1 Tax=Mercenaria mercenaria TaxID=6596 RepID=UPI00234F9880|nr:E3 UFM1-protein ligase 1-like isoform X2 [Mercenaria mercenaria]